MSSDMQEIGQMGRGVVIVGLECVQQYFKLDSEHDQKPAKLLQDWGDVIKQVGGFSNVMGSRTLDHLTFSEGFVRQTNGRRVAIISLRNDKAGPEWKQNMGKGKKVVG